MDSKKVLSHRELGRATLARQLLLTTKNLRVNATVLVDGQVCATWSPSRRGAAATLRIAPFEALPANVRAALEAEGEAVARVSEPTAREVRVVIEEPAA
jgi:hypothetical protein